MKKVKKIIISLTMVCAFILGILSGCTSDQQTGQKLSDEPFKIIVADAKTTHHLNLYVAKELGIFEKYNLDVEIVSVNDLAAARDLVVSGEADIFWACPTVAIAAVANGAPIQIISQVKKPCTSVLVVPQDSPIQTLSDLSGKEIAGISPTCEAVISLTVAAREAGGDFNLQRLGAGESLLALESGSVDGAILEEPQVSIAELSGYKVLFPTISENIPCRTINASNRILASNPEQLELFIQAIDEANKIILSDPIAENIVNIAIEYTGAPQEAIIHGNHRLLFGVEIDVEGLKLLAEELIDLRNITSNPGDAMFAEHFKGITW